MTQHAAAVADGLRGSFGTDVGQLPPLPPRTWHADQLAALGRLEGITQPDAYARNELAALQLCPSGDPATDARVITVARRWSL